MAGSALVGGSLYGLPASVPQTTHTADYFVNAALGSDSNPGTAVKPFATIAHAASVINALPSGQQPGCWAHVAPGQYTEAQINLTANGTATAPIVFVSDLIWTAKITTTDPNAGIYPNSAGQNSASGLGNVYIIGFDVTDAAPHLCVCPIKAGTPNCVVRQCYVHDAGTGLAANTSGGAIDVSNYGDGVNPMGITVEACYIASSGSFAGGNQWHGIYLTGYGEIAQNNLIVGIYSGTGINCWHLSTQQTIINNTVINASRSGILIGSDTVAATNTKVYNNAVYNCGNYGIRTGPQAPGTLSNTDMRNNYLSGNALGATLLGGTGETIVGTVSSPNPMFVNYQATGGGDYRLKAASPLVGAGVSLSVPATDFTGFTRPSPGARYDIGCYQMQASLSAITPVNKTTFKIGTYGPQADTFTSLLDLNDRITYWLATADLAQPQKVYSRSSNIRVQGEKITGWQYKNRHVKATVNLLYASTPATLMTAIQTLIATIENPPYRLAFAAPNTGMLTYADVVAVTHTIPYDGKLILNGAVKTITIDFECAPGFSGDRLYLQNLVPNPGFEAPSGPPVTVFSDPLSGMLAYDPQQWSAVVSVDAPLAWYQLDEASGTVAIDAGSRAQNGTYTGGYTQQQPGPMGGADGAVLLNGTTGYISLPTTSLPSGNAAWSLECWYKVAANPSATVNMLSLGTVATNQQVSLVLTSAGNADLLIQGVATVVGAAATATNTWHHFVATYDGTTARTYVDGVAGGTNAPAALNVTYGAAAIGATAAGASGWFPGQIDECVIYTTTLSAARVTTHFNAGLPAALSLGAPNTYVDVVMANGGASLNNYYRLDESSGTTAYDISGYLYNATTHGSPTQGVAGALSGDTDTCYTLAAASSQFVNCPTSGLPTANAAISVACWMKFAANPASIQALVSWGATGGGTHNVFQLNLQTSGKVAIDNGVGTGVVLSTLALTTATWHFVVGTWDGTTMTLYVDGASQGTATPGAQTIPASSTVFNIGANSASASAPGNFYSGQVDEVCAWSIKLSSTQVSAIYTAGHTGATGTLANTMVAGAGAQWSFGSPVWQNYNIWNTRFRYQPGLVANWYLHSTNGSNYTRLQITTNTMGLTQVVAGVSHTVGTVGITLTPGAWYWLQLTQYLAAPGGSCALWATLSSDQNSSLAQTVAQISGNSFDGVTALSGAPQIACSGAALALSGLSSGIGMQVQTFNPGGWTFNPAISGSAPTGRCAGSVDATAGVPYSGGPTISYYAARIDLPQSGTVDACWRLYAGGLPATNAIPVPTGSVTLMASAWAKSQGLSANALVRLYLYEWDVNGVAVTQTLLQTLTGSQTAWTQLAGTLVTQSNTAYVDLMLRVIDTTTAGESQGGVVWFDNAQCWNATYTNSLSMPYCELRYPQSVASLMVSGLVGQLKAPAQFSLGFAPVAIDSFAPGNTAQLLLGRRAAPTTGFPLVATPYSASSTLVTQIGDGSAYGGVLLGGFLNNAGAFAEFNANPGGLPSVAQAAGAYHVFAQAVSFDASLPTTSVRTWTDIYSGSALNGLGTKLSEAYGAFAYPFPSSGVWGLIDIGQLILPPFVPSALADQTQQFIYLLYEYLGSSGTTYVSDVGVMIMLPVDAETYLAQVVNASNSTVTVSGASGQWLYVYLDGVTPASVYSIEASAIPNPTHSGGSVGSLSTGAISVNPTGDPYLRLDPTTTLPNSGGLGVNEFALAYLESTNNFTGLAVDVAYTPQYLFPREN